MIFKTIGIDTTEGYQPTEPILDKEKPPNQEGLRPLNMLGNRKDSKEVDRFGDPWEHRKEGMKCESCMWFCNMRCRKHAPTMGGYPAVFPTDWCGDHKLDKKDMGGK